MPADIELEQSLDLELLHRAMHLAYLVPTSSYASPLRAGALHVVPLGRLRLENTRMARHALLTPATNPTNEAVTKAYGAQPNQRSSQ